MDRKRSAGTTGRGHIDPLAPAPGRAITNESLRVDTIERGFPMDLALFLALAVGLLIVVSGYFLFNDAPSLGRSQDRRRR
jgi:hypothetical protein